MNRERDGIQGSGDEKYVFSHLNMVEFDEEGNLLEAEEIRRLRIISFLKNDFNWWVQRTYECIR